MIIAAQGTRRAYDWPAAQEPKIFTAMRIHFDFLPNRATPTNYKCWEFYQQKEETSWNMGKCEIIIPIIMAKVL